MHPFHSFRIVPLTVDHCRELCSWRYEPPYNLYAWRTWTEMEKEQLEFGDPHIRDAQYAAVLDAEDGLAGFAQFFPLVGVTRIGLGMRPELCGLGLGTDIVTAIVEEAKKRAPGQEIDLEVPVWNIRAHKVYERAGFIKTDRYELQTKNGTAEFYCMVYEGKPL